jgi:tetratricopeptide (TPR) repeat protein
MVLDNLDYWRLSRPTEWVSTTDRREAASFLVKQVNRVRAAQLEAVDRIVVSQWDVKRGIAETARQVEEMVAGVEHLNSTFQWGLSEIIWQLEEQGDTLRRILEALQKPLTTQAIELRDRASRAYRHGWLNEALRDYSRSVEINPYDFTAHQSLGNIYVFHRQDLDKALMHYEKAAKYARPESAGYAAFALLHVAMVRYLKRDYEESYEATSEALTLCPQSHEAHYRHAQYCARLSRGLEAIQHLERAIRGDRYYALAADTTADFRSIEKELEELFNDLRSEQRKEIQNRTREAQEQIREAEAWTSSDPDTYAETDRLIQEARAKLERAEVLYTAASLFDLYDAVEELCQAKGAAVDAEYLALYATQKRYESEIKQLDERHDSIGKDSLLDRVLIDGLVLWLVVATLVGAVLFLLVEEEWRWCCCAAPVLWYLVLGGVFLIATLFDWRAKASLKEEIETVRDKLSRVECRIAQLK